MLLIAPLTSLVQAAVPESAYADLSWRLLGPFRGGWVTAVAGHPDRRETFYFGSADGGVWRTDNAGATWQPLFERGGSASIGALTLAPGNPEVIWIGTGQIQQRWDVVDGDGVYRSVDGGQTWQHVGLEGSRHIGALWVDPRNADTAVVAALGPVFGASPERGLFRTEDGGAHWEKVLYVNDTTGAADIAYDPQQPDVLYVSLWQMQRHPWLDYFQPTLGDHSGIYRSNDGGRSWAKVPGDGLPVGPLGRIELAVAPAHGSQRVWASIQTSGDGGAVYVSEDGGAHWEQVNADSSLASSYMAWLTADPVNAETVWAGGQPLRRSTDGGASFTIVRSSPGGDDYHALWIDPNDSRRMIAGADQGAVVTFNGGESWSSWYNQPTGQFYRLAVDDDFPYRVYSGQQDSGTVSIASRSDYGRISFRDWNPVGGDERDGDVPDPQDSNIVYGAGLGGRISRWNARTAQVQNVSPWPVSSYAADPVTVQYRYDWITPLAISAVPPHAMYTAAQLVFRSGDGGQSWQSISPDLSGADPTATNCRDAPRDRATACGYGVIFSIAPSPLQDGLVWAGTNNGRVFMTGNGGERWDNVTPTGLEDWSRVNLIDASAVDTDTAYLAVDRHRLNDFKPRAYVTHDAGKNWREIGHGLPDGAYVNVVRQDPQHPGLLYAGTSRGVHVSFDDGEHWQSLQLNLPTTGVNDLLVHNGDLVIATQGRAIWVLTAIAPLRHLAVAGPRSKRATTAELVPPAPAVRLRFNQNKDTPLPPEEPTGENPPAGAILDYILPDGFTGPVQLDILAGDGSVIRSFDSESLPPKATARVYFAQTWLGNPQPLSATPGHHRFVWNLRYAPPSTLESEYSIAAVPEIETPILPDGAFVLPGTYTVRLSAGNVVSEQALTVVMDPRVTTTDEELTELLAFQQEVAAVLQRTVAFAQDAKESATGPDAKLPESIATALTGLLIDLEHVDAPPTESQRAVLASEAERLARLQGD